MAIGTYLQSGGGMVMVVVGVSHSIYQHATALGCQLMFSLLRSAADLLGSS